jgi:serine/threonine protein kinase/formylglycine-generating enzyme required for sulfatase activity
MDPKADTVNNDSDDSLGPVTEELAFEVIQPAEPGIDSGIPRSPRTDELTRTTKPLTRRDLAKTSEAPPADSDQVRDGIEPDDDTAGTSHSSGADTLAAREAEAISPESSVGPDRIGPFRVIRLLGVGNFGRVYLCHDEQLNRLVAIKMPRSDRFTGPDGVSRFLREAQHAALVQHPGIVTMHRVDFDDVLGCYVVMEYIEGWSLATVLRKKQLTATRAIAMLIAVAEAMSFAHEKGLVHRDLKPENILMDKQGQPHIADFGLAVHEDDRWPIRGEIAGTPVYMAPEQVRGESHRLDGRTDLWALGVILYRMLTGHRPFDGSCTEEIFEDILDREPVPPRQRDRTISRELERICLKCVAKRMTDRYATASDFADDLRNWLTSAATVSAGEHARTPTVPSNDGKNTVLAESRSSDREIVTPMRVRPKGLRAFDGEDRDFFLELLPGPRDRDGLPESLRFWLVRIEPRKHQSPFSVGLVCGPSGSGKTSMVKAGLLCRLSEDLVVPIYVEATPGATEARLKAQLCRLTSGGSDDLNLPEIVAGLRSGVLQASGRKVLIVLDQFEQWLHARQAFPEGEDDLIHALRQCDGAHVQCLVLVRDDFAMAAARFMRALEIRLVESENFATVDLFDLVHARKVLRAFGVAYDRFKGDDQLGPHERFLDQAAAELADDGKIAPVRLALFAQMIKDKPWTPATLRDVGGLQGIGVTFLDESLVGPAANPEHRLHLPAARQVLKALLPQGAADIKGYMRSYHELLVESGYLRRQGDFDTLLAILGTELRLITPTDPRGYELGDVEQPGPPAGRYYHLTHDYLVPSLREWIHKNETKTIRGRAAIRLAERTVEWTARRSRRYLPAWWEWIMMLLFTRHSQRTPAENRLMRAATRYHVTRLAALASAVAIVSGLIYAGLGSVWARSAINELLIADAKNVSQRLKTVAIHRLWADSLLREIVSSPGYGSHDKVRARLALLPVDRSQSISLVDPLLNAEPDEFVVIRQALTAHGDRAALAEKCRQVLGDGRTPPEKRIRAGMALAGMLDERQAPADLTLGEAGEFLANQFVKDLIDHPDRYNDWMAAMQPARLVTTPHFHKIYRAIDQPENARLAATILAKFVGEDPDSLTELLLDADVRQFPVIYDALARFHSTVKPQLVDLIQQATPAGDTPEAHWAHLSRQANAAIGLLRCGESDVVWPLLRHTPDPLLRTYLVDRLPTLVSDPSAIAQRLEVETDVSARRALILVLGGIPVDHRSASWAVPAAERLADLYRNDPDAGIHSAVEWALLKWNQRDRLREITPQLAGRRISDRFGWYLTSEGQTMTTLGPETFQMGAGEHEQDRESDEEPVTRTIPRIFSIATKEVTAAEFLEFRPDFDRFPNDVCRDKDCSINVIQWNAGIAYCRWLSDREKIAEDQMCYPPLIEIEEGAKPYPDYLSRRGYRLPTEAELEYAGRAGAITSRYFGDDAKMLSRYGWFYNNSSGAIHRGGMLLPNDFGLFDALGNVKEWCHDSYEKTMAAGPDREDLAPFESGVERVARGGAYLDPARVVRSANRYYTKANALSLSAGFRIARTVKKP